MGDKLKYGYGASALSRITVLFLVVLVMCVGGYWIGIELVERNQEKTTKMIAENAYTTVQSDFDQCIRVSKTMSYDTFLKDFLEREDKYSESQAEQIMSDYLGAIKYGNSWASAFLISDKTKRYYTPDGIGKIVDPVNNDYDVWYSVFVESVNDYDLDINIDEYNTKDYTVFVDKRVEDDDSKLLGVCGVGMVMSNIQEEIEEYENEYGASVSFADDKGEVLIGPSVNNLASRYLYVEIPDETHDNTFKRDGFIYEYAKYMPSMGWNVVVRTDATKEIKSLYRIPIFSVVVLCVFGIAILINDLNKKRNFLRYVKVESLRDKETGLFNLEGFGVSTIKEMNTLSNHKRGGCMFVICLDNFRHFTDIFGRGVADQMINNVAEALMELFAETDIIGRIDEDEFSVFAPNMTDEGYIGDMSGRILKCIRREYSSEGRDVMFSASIGAAVFKDPDDEFSTLKDHASQALRTVQNDGGDGFSLYRVL